MKEFNFQNFCSHGYQVKELFAEKTFNVLKCKPAKKESFNCFSCSKDEEEEKIWEKKTDAITDHDKVTKKKEKRSEKNQKSINNQTLIQIEAALYLGNNQISENSYTKP
jgi:hypothetical protein